MCYYDLMVCLNNLPLQQVLTSHMHDSFRGGGFELEAKQQVMIPDIELPVGNNRMIQDSIIHRHNIEDFY